MRVTHGVQVVGDTAQLMCPLLVKVCVAVSKSIESDADFDSLEFSHGRKSFISLRSVRGRRKQGRLYPILEEVLRCALDFSC